MLARTIRVPLLVAGVAFTFALTRKWPTEQSVHVILGDAAPGAVELRIRYGEPAGGHDEWQREATFHYARGQAPRIVSHEPRLVNGEYDVEIEINMATRAAHGDAVRTVTETRRVRLGGGTASIDVSQRALEASVEP